MNDSNYMRHLIFLIMVLMIHSLSSAQQAPADMASFYQQDQILLNACKPSEQKRLRDEIFTMARGRKPDQAWLLINKVLCGDDIKSYYYVKAHIIQDPEPEQETASVADEEGEKQIRETSEYLARKQVWDVSVIDISDTIRVLFSVDGGVCVRGFDFKFWNDSWWVVANELACD